MKYPRFHSFTIGCVTLLILSALSHSAEPDLPPIMRSGVILHLDASQPDSLELDEKGGVKVWKDLSPTGNDAVSRADSRPVFEPKGIHDLGSVRFGGDAGLIVERLAEGPGPLTAFAVIRRTEEQASDREWQRVLSSWDSNTKGDVDPPSFFMDAGKSGKARPPCILIELGSGSSTRGELHIGENMQTESARLRGDIGEIIVFDHSFLVFEQVQQVKDYLKGKWGISEASQDDWTLRGPAPESPVRKTNERPLSDQDDQQGWTRFDPLSDEFDQGTLDPEKWWDHNPEWYGRLPARFLAENVRVADGKLGLTMKIDHSLPREALYRNGKEYHTYSSASVVGKELVRYGYFEVKARPMPSAGSSSFWFAGKARGKDGKRFVTEIDVFEMGGGSEDYRQKYVMNAHVFRSPKSGSKHWSIGGTWVAPYEFKDDFHVYGLEWTPEHLKYFVDGVLVRWVKNTDWHTPLSLIFDSETMFDWLGVPKEEDLPSTFHVEYIRAWKNPETDADWRQDFSAGNKGQTAITRYVRSMDEKREKRQESGE